MEKGSSAEELRTRREFLSDIEDEISLVELWMVLVRRWKIIAIIFSLCLVLGITAAFSVPTKFLFSTTVELALANSTLVEPAASVLAKLKGKHIPLVLSAEKDSELFEIDVEHPRRSKSLVLTSLGLATDAEAIRRLHQSVFDLLSKDQHALIEMLDAPRKKEYSLLESQIKTNAVRISKLKQSETLLENTLMILGGGAISSKEDGIDVLQAQALNSHALVSAEYATVEYQSKLFYLGSEIDMSRDTSAEAIAVRSLKPSGIGKVAIIFLSAMVGLFVGGLVAFVLEFIVKARCTVRASE